MSLKSFFHAIGEFISNIFKKAEPVAKKAVAFAVDLTNKVKDFDDKNPGTVDLLTQIIPGSADDKVKTAIREKLPQIMTELKLVDSTLNLTDPNEIVASAIATLKTLSGDYKAAFLSSLANIVAVVAADGKLDMNDAILLVKWYYDHQNNDAVDTTVEPTPTVEVTEPTTEPAKEA